MSQKINKIARNISKILNFSPNLLTNDMTVTLYCDYQAVISGYKKILIYDDNMLLVSNGEMQLKIVGSNFVLHEMLDNELIVNGKIKTAEFEKTRR